MIIKKFPEKFNNENIVIPGHYSEVSYLNELLKILNNQLEILYEQLNELQNDPNNDMNEDETILFQNNSEKLTNKIFAFRDNRIDVMDASKGKKSEICNDFIKNICSKVMK